MDEMHIKYRIKNLKSMIIIASISIFFIITIKVNIDAEVVNHIKELNNQVVQRIEATTKHSYKKLEYINKYINELKETYGNEYDENTALTTINDRVNRTLFNSVGISDINGNMNFGNMIVQVKDREYFKQALKGKEYVSKIITGRHNQQQLIGFSKPLENSNGEVEGVLVGYSDYTDISELLNITLYSGNVKSYVLNKYGDVIIGDKNEFIKNTKSELNINENNSMEDLYNKGIYKIKGKYISCDKVKGNSEWFVLSSIPINVVFKNLKNIMYLLTIATMLFILIYISNDILKSKANRKKYLKAKYIDNLTNIENKESFKLNINKIIQRNKDNKYILLSLDVVSFKFINEIFGYEKGNDILKNIAINIKKLPSQLVLGRIENDVFGIMMEYKDDININEELDKIRECARKNNTVEESSYNLEFNIGITTIEYGDNIDKKLDEIDLARFECKKHNELSHYFYDKQLENRKKQMLIIENELVHALNNDEFKLVYQPKIDCITRKIVGVEALIRWISKEYGFISPEIFIPIAERNGNINLIGKWVLEEVCKIIQKSTDNNETIVPISINVSRVELYRSDFIENVIDLISKYEVDTKLLEFEITETTALNDTKYINEQIKKIKDIGIKVSMDDFGTGSSTLSNLKCIDIDILKIDRSILLDIEKNKKSKALVRNIINIAKEFGFEVVCEGIETMDQVDILERIDCDIIQGYVFSKPIEWEEIKCKWLKNNN